jgi:hypothetical protein
MIRRCVCGFIVDNSSHLYKVTVSIYIYNYMEISIIDKQL